LEHLSLRRWPLAGSGDGPEAVALAHRQNQPAAISAGIGVPERITRGVPVEALRVGAADEETVQPQILEHDDAAELADLELLAFAGAQLMDERAQDRVG